MATFKGSIDLESRPSNQKKLSHDGTQDKKHSNDTTTGKEARHKKPTMASKSTMDSLIHNESLSELMAIIEKDEKEHKIQNSETKTKGMRKVWSRQEDVTVLKLVQIHGLSWTKISNSMGNSRSERQIRDRYINKLDPRLTHVQWTEEEDLLLVDLFKLFGKKWSEISKHLPGRSEPMIKNRFQKKFKHLLEIDESIDVC